MRFYLFFLLLFSTQIFAQNDISGKSLICKYGKKGNIYEAYLFYKKKYISKYLFLENDTYRIRNNEKRSYNLTGDHIKIKPFLIDKTNLEVLDTEFDVIIGSCKIYNNHETAINFMKELSNKMQKAINDSLGRQEI